MNVRVLFAPPQCYLCKVPGHTTSTCPHRILPSTSQPSSRPGLSLLRLLTSRQTALTNNHTRLASLGRGKLPLEWHVSAAITKTHTRRISALAFHCNSPDILISCDKVCVYVCVRRGWGGVWWPASPLPRPSCRVSHCLGDAVLRLPVAPPARVCACLHCHSLLSAPSAAGEALFRVSLRRLVVSFPCLSLPALRRRARCV